MSDSRRSSLPPQPSARRVLSLEGQTADLVVAPVDWLDYFPAEADTAVIQEAVTFVVEPATSITEPPQRSRTTRRRRLRHGWVGILQRQQQRVVSVRLWLATRRRRVAAASMASVSGIGRFAMAVVAAVVQVVITIALLPWRLLAAAIAGVRTARGFASRSAGRGWRYSCALASALRGRVLASVIRALHGVHRALQFLVQSAVSLVMVTVRGLAHGVVAAAVGSARLVFLALHTIVRSIRVSAARFRDASVSAAREGFGALRRATAAMRLRVIGLLSLMSTAVGDLRHRTRTLAQLLRVAALRRLEAARRAALRATASLRAAGRMLTASRTRVERAMAHAAHAVRLGSNALRSKLHAAARHGGQTARRHPNAALIACRATWASVAAGAVCLSRDTSVALGRMHNTVLVIRVPAGSRDRHGIVRHPVLASAGALVALSLVVAVTRVDDALPQRQPLLAGTSVMGAGLPQAVLPVVPAAAWSRVAALLPAIPQRAPSVGPRESPITLSRNDRRAIQAVLNQYRDALSVLDVSALADVWPGADAAAVRAAFANVVEQNVEFERCRIAPRGVVARADCAGVVESGFSAGQRRPRVERTRWEFTLQKRGNHWMITAVDMLPG